MIILATCSDCMTIIIDAHWNVTVQSRVLSSLSSFSLYLYVIKFHSVDLYNVSYEVFTVLVILILG